jgi:glutathione S-transferase
MPTRLLYSMPYSPWSERARWALLHHGIDFEERPHTPMLGELALRARAKRWTGRVTVPLLVDGDVTVMDSYAIATYCDSIGGGDKLIDSPHREPISQINEEIEALTHTLRAHLVLLTHKHDDVALAMSPRALRSLPGTTAAARMGASFIARKHAASMENVEERMRAGFRAIRARLAGRDYVFDRFSYADILCATPISAIAPVAERYISFEPALRKHLHHPTLAAEFDDLVKWRDATYEKHRPVSAAAK